MAEVRGLFGKNPTTRAKTTAKERAKKQEKPSTPSHNKPRKKGKAIEVFLHKTLQLIIQLPNSNLRNYSQATIILLGGPNRSSYTIVDITYSKARRNPRMSKMYRRIEYYNKGATITSLVERNDETFN